MIMENVNYLVNKFPTIIMQIILIKIPASIVLSGSFHNKDHLISIDVLKIENIFNPCKGLILCDLFFQVNILMQNASFVVREDIYQVSAQTIQGVFIQMVREK